MTSENANEGQRLDDDVRTGLSIEAFKRAYEEKLRYVLGRFPEVPGQDGGRIPQEAADVGRGRAALVIGVKAIGVEIGLRRGGALPEAPGQPGQGAYMVPVFRI